jgi:hypothetical protein
MKTRISGKEAARVAEDMAIRCGSAKPVANYYEAVRPSLAHQLVEANLGPFRTAVELIGSIPDIKNLGAHVIVSEIGIDSLLVAAPITVEGLDQLILKPKQLDGITAVYERGEHPGIHGCPAGYCEERRCRQGGFNAPRWMERQSNIESSPSDPATNVALQHPETAEMEAHLKRELSRWADLAGHVHSRWGSISALPFRVPVPPYPLPP